MGTKYLTCGDPGTKYQYMGTVVFLVKLTEWIRWHPEHWASTLEKDKRVCSKILNNFEILITQPANFKLMDSRGIVSFLNSIVKTFHGISINEQNVFLFFLFLFFFSQNNSPANIKLGIYRLSFNFQACIELVKRRIGK